jgi:hypothetical protein
MSILTFKDKKKKKLILLKIYFVGYCIVYTLHLDCENQSVNSA